MRICPIARLRRLESRFSGQNGPRSSEMRVYIEITGYIKNHQNFKILFCSWESKKLIFTIFLEFFLRKNGSEIWESMTSETTWESMTSETTRESITSETTRESRVRRPGISGFGSEFLSEAKTCIG